MYHLTTYITSKKSSALGQILRPILFVILVPVFIIAFLSSLLVSLFMFIKSPFAKRETDPPPFHEELVLIDRPEVKILMIEDEQDEELAALNDAWSKRVFGQNTYLYRVRTTPVISQLNDTICGYYTIENEEGILLQQLSPTSTEQLNTRMVFLNYKSRDIQIIDDIGAFYLYNEEKTGEIKGFNEMEEILVKLN